MIVPRPLADVDGPGAVGSVSPPGYLFLCNWSDPVELATAFDTAISQAQTLAEERKSLRSRPTRVGQMSLVSLRERDAWQLQMVVQRLSQTDQLLPLFSDFAKITAAASGDTLTCVTSDRRFFEGGRVIIAQLVNAASLVNFEVGTIAAGGVAAGAITLTASVSRTYPAGSRVYPAIEAKMNLSGSLEVVSDQKLVTRLRWAEVIGASQLPGLADADTTPAGFNEYDGEPILHITPNWRQHGTGPRRVGRSSASGRSASTATWGARPLFAKPLGWQFGTRAAAFDLLRFFDSRAGRAFPFLLPSFLDDFTPLALGTTTIDVSPNGPVFDYSHITHIAILMDDGSVVVRAKDSVARLSASVDEITLDSALPSGLLLEDVRRVSACHRVRFDTDEMVERWRTDAVAELSARVIEVINDKVVVILDTSQPPAAGAPDGVPDLSAWHDASVECLSSDSHSGTGEGEQCDTIQAWNTPTTGQGSGSASINDPDYRKRVAFWKDQSGNGRDLRHNHVFGSLTDRPIFRFLYLDPWSTGLPIVMPHFYATLGDVLDEGGPHQWHDETDGLTVFVVGGNREFQGVYDTRSSHMFTASGRWEMKTDTWKLIGDTTVTLNWTPTDAWAIWTGIWTPGISAKAYKNGSTLGVTTTGVPNNLGGTADPFVGAQYSRMAAAVIYARALNVNELNTVGLYLSERYGIGWTTIT